MTNGPTGRFGLPRRDENGSGPPRPPGDGGSGGGDDGSDEPQEDITLSIKGVRARESPDAEGEVMMIAPDQEVPVGGRLF